MYILKPFTTKQEKTSGLPVIDCYIGEVKIGTMTTNLMKKGEGQYVFRSAIVLDGIDKYLYHNDIEEMKEMILNSFRSLIGNLLE